MSTLKPLADNLKKLLGSAYSRDPNAAAEIDGACETLEARLANIEEALAKKDKGFAAQLKEMLAG